MSTFYKSKSIPGKLLILIISYSLALLVLGIYAWIAYDYTPEKILGPVTAVAVFTTDILLFLLIRCRLTNGPLEISIILIGFRAFLFGFGGNLWFIGYCLLYLGLGIFLNYYIV